MKKLFFVFAILGFAATARAEKLEPQFRTWKSSQIQCGNYANVLISSTPIIFHVLNGSATVANSGAANYFALFWSTAQPPATDMSTKALINTYQSTQENSGLGQPWDVVVSTTYGFHIYSYFSKTGGGCPLFYEWDYYNIAPEKWYYNPKD